MASVLTGMDAARRRRRAVGVAASALAVVVVLGFASTTGAADAATL